MNQYLLLNHGTGTPENWDGYFTMLHERGHFIGGSALDGYSAVTMDRGSCGPAQSATLTGYILIQAEDLDAARELARLCPVHLAGGMVEVFPLVES